MRNINIDRGWKFQYMPFSLVPFMAGSDHSKEVNLPHDYMIETDVSEKAPGAATMGYYEGVSAYYEKYINIPETWKEDKVFLEFDGIMMNAVISINGNQVCRHHYGYTPFQVDITHYIFWGEKNRIMISVNPSIQPNSRWYTGAGIFRSVELVHIPKIHIAYNGIFTYTKKIDYTEGKAVKAFLVSEAAICNETLADHIVEVTASLQLEGQSGALITRSVSACIKSEKDTTVRIPVTVTNPKLWDVDRPNLYHVFITVKDMGEFRCALCPAEGTPMIDRASVLFGIRTIHADSMQGLRINEVSTNLRGGCLHHDNGVLGAVSLYACEYRKIKRLKESGFNMIRLAHNPPSKVLLEVCDRLGMYVLNEAFDSWGMAKQPGDYSQYFMDDWKDDVKSFIMRDRNHPSILFWSTGNEIIERGGLGNGYQIAADIAEYIRGLDGTRLLTNGLCSFWNGLDDPSYRKCIERMQESMSQMEVSEQNASIPETDGFWEKRTEPFAGMLDVVGYNYMEDHYELSGKLYPERVIIGTESYPAEIDKVWDYVEKLPYVIGDCTWTAFDYIGEAGIGRSIYVDADDPVCSAPWLLLSQTVQYPWRLANDADFDINGNVTPQGNYRRIVWGSKDTYIYTTDPKVYKKTEVISKWGWQELYESWNWKEQEGKPIHVVVYSAADEIELFLNNHSMGKAPAGKDNRYKASFDIIYERGKLEAISYTDGEKVSSAVLATTGEPASIRLVIEKENCDLNDDVPAILCDGHSLAYISVEIIDMDGNIVPEASVELIAEVSGSCTLAGFGSANPVTEENYTSGHFTAYHGRALAVLRSGYESGKAELVVSAKELGQSRAVINVREGSTVYSGLN